MKKAALRVSCIAVVALALLMGFATMAPAIEIRDGGGGDLRIEFYPEKPAFASGEAIRFNVRGNRDFYLYLFTVDKDAGKTYQILPNARQRDNGFAARRTYTLPSGNIEFYSSRPGVERVIMVASTKRLDLGTTYAKEGDFFSASASQFEEEFKSLKIRTKQSRQQVIKELDVIIVGN